MVLTLRGLQLRIKAAKNRRTAHKIDVSFYKKRIQEAKENIETETKYIKELEEIGKV